MTWSAESVSQFLQRQYGNFELLCLSPQSDTPESLPAIAHLLGERRFYLRISKTSLGAAFPMFLGWTKAVLWMVAIFVTVLLKIFENKVGQVLSRGQDGIFSVGTFLLFMPVAALTVGFEELVNRLTTRPRLQKVKSLRESIELLAMTRPTEFERLVALMVRDLRRMAFPRALIVDGFERLDLLTREVLKDYIRQPGGPGGGSEIWAIFEGISGERFSNHIAGNPLPEGRKAQFFHQLSLEPRERSALAERLGAPERASFAAIKMICRPDASANQQYSRLLEEYTSQHPPARNSYGDLELLYLLWLDVYPWQDRLDWHSAVRRLSAKPRKRKRYEPVEKLSLLPDLLRSILPGTALAQHEFHAALSRLEEAFAQNPLLDVEVVRGVKRLILHDELRLAFKELGPQIRLPREGLVQIFWSIFWYNRLRDHPLQAFWIRKLGRHLIRCDLGSLQGAELLQPAGLRLLEAIVFTLRGAILTCVYEPIPELLEQAVLLASSFEIEPSRGLRKKLRDVCWEAYSLTGSDAALTSFWRLLDAQAGVSRKPRADLDELARIFLDALPVPPQHRTVLEKLFTGSSQVARGQETLLVYARLRSTALVFLSVEALADEEAELYPGTCARGCAAFPNLLRQLDAGLGSRKKDLPATDLLALSLGLWCTLHSTSPSILLRLAYESEKDRKQVFMVQLTTMFRLLLDTADSAVLIADDLPGELTADRGSDLVRIALARDLCTVVLAALVGGAHNAVSFGLGPLLADSLERVRQVARMACEQLRTEPLDTSSPEALAGPENKRRILALLEMKSFLFRRFELRSLALLAESRRVLLAQQWSTMGEDRWVLSRALREDLHQTELRADFATLFGLLSLTTLFRGSAELQADYHLQSATLALEADFAPDLQRRFAVTAIALAHHLPLELGPYLEFLCRPSESGEPMLAKYLAAQSDAAVLSLSLPLLNAANRSQLGQCVRDILAQTARSQCSNTAREEIQLLLEYFTLREHLDTGTEIDTSAILHDWSARQQHWCYADLVLRLLRSGKPEILAEAIRILEGIEPPGSNTVFLHLALQSSLLLEREGRLSSLRELPLSYLAAAMAFWEDSLTADSNSLAYRLLFQASGGTSDLFAAKTSWWTTVKLQHDEASRLLPLMRKGHFFSLFLYYFQFLRGWGLKTDLEPEKLQARLQATPEARRQEVEQWVERGREVPEPFLSAGDRAFVTSEFILVGHDLFQPPLLDDPAYDEDRRAFDHSALVATTRLVKKSSELPALPLPIRDLLLGHSRRFESFTLPTEGELA